MIPLRISQQHMVEHIKEHPKCGIFAEMGCGKTRAVLEAIKDLPKPVLIVAPLRVAQHVWHAEAAKWGYDYSFSHILGDRDKRKGASFANADVYVINIENLDWLRREYDTDWKWKTVVFDESSLLKTAGSKRSRAALWISRRVPNVILLTGTPAPNGLPDLYHQVKILDGGKRLGRSINAFRKQFCYPENPYFVHTKWLVRDNKVAEVHNNIGDICLSLTTEDYADMPDSIVNDIVIELAPAGRLDYEHMRQEMLLEIGDDDITAMTAGSLVAKLGQLASGAIYDQTRQWFITDYSKLVALDDIIEEAAGQPVLVWYNYIHSLERIYERYAKHKVMTVSQDGAVESWNSGKLDILLAHPQSAGHGLNLQEGGHIAVWYDMVWNLEHYEQANARLARPGQDHKVFIHRLLAADTIDQDIAVALENKGTVQATLMSALGVKR